MINKNLSQEEFERIERYLRSEMPESEHITFEKSMAEDKDLSDAVDQLRMEISAIEEVSFRASLNDFHNTLDEQSEDRKIINLQQAQRTRFPRWAIAASVAFLIGLGIYFSNQAPKHEQLFAEHFSPDPGLSTPMSSTDNYAFYRGMVDYKQGKYEEALTRWNELLKTKPSNDSLNYFIGMSMINQDRIADAMPYLDKVINSPTTAFMDESNYYLGLTKLKQGDIDQARKYLIESNRSEASEILQELKNL